MGFWDSYGSGDRFKFNTPGDVIEGEILRLTSTTFGGQTDPVPVVALRTAKGDFEVTASNVILLRRLAELGPEVGDHIQIRYDGLGEAKPGKSAPKLFTVTVKRAGKGPDLPDAWKRDEEPF